MDKKEVIKSPLEVVDKFDLATMAGVKNEALAGYMYACVESLSKVNGVRVDDFNRSCRFFERKVKI